MWAPQTVVFDVFLLNSLERSSQPESRYLLPLLIIFHGSVIVCACVYRYPLLFSCEWVTDLTITLAPSCLVRQAWNIEQAWHTSTPFLVGQAWHNSARLLQSKYSIPPLPGPPEAMSWSRPAFKARLAAWRWSLAKCWPSLINSTPPLSLKATPEKFHSWRRICCKSSELQLSGVPLTAEYATLGPRRRKVIGTY